eukprot:624148-Prymnesium_polylepis.1
MDERNAELERMKAARRSAVDAELAETMARPSLGCTEYHVDTSAACFGNCVCGEPKNAHSAEAVAAGRRSAVGSSVAVEVSATPTPSLGCTEYR